MKIGIVFEGSPKKPGGFYQSLQSLTLLNDLKSAEYNFEVITLEKETFNFLKDKFNTILFKSNLVLKLFNFMTNSIFFSNIIFKHNIKHPFEKFLNKNKFDLIIFLSPHNLCFFCGTTNFIFNIWDLDHKKNTPFPEHRINYNYRKREDLIDFVLFHSFKIIIPDKKICNELIQIYKCDKSKLLIQNFIPYLPRFYNENKDKNYENIFSKLKIKKKKIILYPATFWPHKNHHYLIEVAKILKKKNNQDYIFVLCGSDKGTIQKINSDIEEYGLDNYFHIFQLLSDEELISIYLKTYAVIMTTDGGPTNLPMYEAFFLKKPLFYSNHLLENDDDLNKLFVGINTQNPNDLYDKLINLDQNKLSDMVNLAENYFAVNCSGEKFKTNYFNILSEFKNKKNW